MSFDANAELAELEQQFTPTGGRLRTVRNIGPLPHDQAELRALTEAAAPTALGATITVTAYPLSDPDA